MQIRAQFPDLFLASMLPALDELIFSKFDRFPPQYTQIYRVMSSNRSIEQTSEIAGLGTFGQIAENGSVRYDEMVPGFNKTFTHNQYGLGFKMSRIMIDDDRWGIINKPVRRAAQRFPWRSGQARSPFESLRAALREYTAMRDLDALTPGPVINGYDEYCPALQQFYRRRAIEREEAFIARVYAGHVRDIFDSAVSS